MSATTQLKSIIDNDEIICHFVCIPTEKNGEPFYKFFEEVLNNILKRKDNKFNIKECVIIESTLMPFTRCHSERLVSSIDATIESPATFTSASSCL